MKLIELYKAILATCNMCADVHGLISHIAGFDEQGKAQMAPELVIPPSSTNRVQRQQDRGSTQEAPRLFIKLKQYRTIATHYDKAACTFLGYSFI